ncbi:MAG: hypothetical protein AAGC93_20495 [Cyanobacteria bacterium P01_F01_bin.53]
MATLLLLMTSCGVLAKTPPDQAIKLAVSQTLAKTQENLAQELGLRNQVERTPNFKISQLKVDSREKLTADDVRLAFLNGVSVDEVYRVRGTFRATLTTTRSSKDNSRLQQTSPFEIYLGTNKITEQEPTEAIETWFLVQPSEYAKRH